MTAEDKNYYKLLIIHAGLAVAMLAGGIASKIYAVSFLVYWTYVIVNSRNQNNEALYAAGYIVGAEVLLRMTGGNLLYELGKYSVVFVLLIGTYYKGFSKNGSPYWIFLLLLIPGIIVATQTLGHDVEMRKTIAFNISGPVCLGVSALYCYMRPITQKQIYELLKYIGLPILSITIYLIFKTPDLRESITSTGSNYATSGGFGPNQVSTILGLGVFIFFSRIVFCSPGKIMLIVNLLITANIAFRTLITFSRGGMITGIAMICVMMAIVYMRLNSAGRWKLNFMTVCAVGMAIGIWLYSTDVTGGLIEKRYQNQDAAGRVKESNFSGREELAATEIEDFLENPIFGIGVARGAEMRILSGMGGLSHNEVTRMLAEHGAFGILGLAILFITPLILYLDNRHHFLMFSFLIFWFMTINHAAMRLAAPAFIYGLAVLKIIPDAKETNSLHRQ
ncbi:O-antigen ligase [Flavobacterium sp.]|uniref:O-antigen ligase family protein n=1 Tax=Flavobacterium sp. TaxID=239 RepID=UPI001205BCCC|nr:O-antigen ligase family protein [Flavobacterium sp.]RZJ70871.1 MAG: O-antigen ligase domain-containing protein [Flavobacterium sp.]